MASSSSSPVVTSTSSSLTIGATCGPASSSAAAVPSSLASGTTGRIFDFRVFRFSGGAVYALVEEDSGLLQEAMEAGGRLCEKRRYMLIDFFNFSNMFLTLGHRIVPACPDTVHQLVVLQGPGSEALCKEAVTTKPKLLQHPHTRL
ncbi:hypothetical protein E3N88_43073 [Mikania micrantha]|uniref:Uncharacterized protein n=1 Tax=Mikania micrantha TaxID=192012 RepID=A0A5N6LG31_9ASTR|nr:hypothetical protein E3N88_43073 [Mikania micrantha]